MLQNFLGPPGARPAASEILDLDALYQRFVKDQGLVILGVDDEEAAKSEAFPAAQQKMKYPVLLDPGRKVNEMFQVDGIPKTFVYDRGGQMVAQSIDMRTRGQFLAMLSGSGVFR